MAARAAVRVTMRVAARVAAKVAVRGVAVRPWGKLGRQRQLR